MTEDKKQDEPIAINLADLVPKPRPEIFTLLGAAEAGIKSVREELEKVPPNQPTALMRITTVKAAIVSIEALLQQQVTDTILKVQAVSIASHLTDVGGKDLAGALTDALKEAKQDDSKAKEVKASGYL